MLLKVRYCWQAVPLASYCHKFMVRKNSNEAISFCTPKKRIKLYV
jgi:hypothetical protein